MALLRIVLPLLIVATSVVVALIRLTMAGSGGGRALVVIDVQYCFSAGGSLAVPDGNAVIPVINRLRADHAEHFDVVVLSQDWHCSDHVSFASQHPGHRPYDIINLTYLTTGELCTEGDLSSTHAINCTGLSTDTVQLSQVLWPDHCIINRSDSLFHSDLDVLPTDLVVQKGYHCHIDSYSAFYDNGHMSQTELHEVLTSRDITSLYIVGLATDYCVFYTAIDANSLGYQTFVVLDATRGISAETIDSALATMKDSGVQIINSTAVAATFAYSSAAVTSHGLLHTTVGSLVLFIIQHLVMHGQ